jgi:hypothetical protein
MEKPEIIEEKDLEELDTSKEISTEDTETPEKPEVSSDFEGGTKAAQSPKKVRFKKGEFRRLSDDNEIISVTYDRGNDDSFDRVFLGENLIGTSRLAYMNLKGVNHIKGTQINATLVNDDNSAGVLYFTGGELIKLFTHTNTSGGETEVADGYVLKYSTFTHVPYWSPDTSTDTSVTQSPTSGTTRYPLLLKYNGDARPVTGTVKFSNAFSNDNISLLSATGGGDLYSKTLSVVENVTAASFTVSGTDGSSPTYIKGDGSGVGGVFTAAIEAGSDPQQQPAQAGTAGLVPAPSADIAGATDKYLRSDGIWDTPPQTPAGDDVNVKQLGTTGTDRYALVFRNITGVGSSDTADKVRYSGTQSNSQPILSATGNGDLHSKSLTTHGGSITIDANAATPTNELVLKNTTSTNATPKIRFQRGSTTDSSLDWTIQANTSGSLVISYISSSTPAARLTMSSSTNTFAGKVTVSGGDITASNGNIVCIASGKYFKGLFERSSSLSSAYILDSVNQPIYNGTIDNRTEDTKPVTAKNVVQYVENDLENYLPLAGGTMTGDISMGDSNNITNLHDGVSNSDAATVGQSLVKEHLNDDTYFNAEGLRISSVASPQSDLDAANKAYVDSRVSSVTISTQDISYDQLDGLKDFNVATVAVPRVQQGGSYYLNFTNKMEKGSICHVMLHTSYSGENENPSQINYASTPVVVKIPANIRVWDATGEGAVSGDMEYVWINGEQVMESDVSTNSSYNGYGKSFTIPSGGFVEISVFFVRDECTIKKGETYQTIKVFRTIIKVDAPTSSYSPLN